jgi:hypothetical protein
VTRREQTLETYDTDQPWIVYTYLTTDRRTRITGRSKVRCECCICGKDETLTIRIPRFGTVDKPQAGKHVQRLEFLQRHLHPDRPHPMAWVRPLRNPAAHAGGVDLDLLAMRLEADLREERSQ